MMKPILSIGIIFKNEIRCLERCLKSLQPLRDAIPCELVMADTGSEDGSREVAERYADILIDFSWIDDFSAARNAVLERCSGQWCMSVDADEWLVGDFSQLTRFLRNSDENRTHTLAAVTVRNFTSADLESQYSDFLGIRLANMSHNPRYQGAIHERWTVEKDIFVMNQVFLHHDGYVGLTEEAGRPKRERNMALLKKKLEENPEDLQTLLQCVESTGYDEEGAAYLRLATEGVEAKRPGWNISGPSIFRYAVNDAKVRKLPELDERAARAYEWFPDSPFVTIDVSFMMLTAKANQKSYAEVIRYGEKYLEALEEYRQGGQTVAATLYGTLAMTSTLREQAARIILADAYFQEKRHEKARDMLLTLRGGEMNQDCVRNCIGVMANLQAQSGLDMSKYMPAFWEQITAPVPSEERAAERQRGAAELAVRFFSRAYRAEEEKQDLRHAYKLFRPLAGTCGWGDAAAILEEDDPETLRRLLAQVGEWKSCPIEALAHALERGTVFPLPEKPLTLEEMDSLAGRLAQDRESLLAVIGRLGEVSDLQTLAWVRGLFLAAVQVYSWKEAENGMDLARKFAVVERQFLTLCYAPEMLRPENLFVLPAMHRFGWYCARAFEALDSGDPAGYVRHLRQGLSACEGTKAMVEFLVDHTPQVQAGLPSRELRELADKIRGILSNYDPADPAVSALKQSEAYRKVAHLIEEPEAPAAGNLAQ